MDEGKILSKQQWLALRGKRVIIGNKQANWGSPATEGETWKDENPLLLSEYVVHEISPSGKYIALKGTEWKGAFWRRIPEVLWVETIGEAREGEKPEDPEDPKKPCPVGV